MSTESTTAKPLTEADAKKLYERMVALEEQSQGTNQQLQAIHDQLRTVHQTIETITELQALPEAKETWMPIAPGAYVKGTVSPAATILLSVGAGTAVEKTPAQVIETLKEHLATLEELADGAIAELKDAHAEMETIKDRVEGMAAPESSEHDEHDRHHHGPGHHHSH